jgi:hypothetical protein
MGDRQTLRRNISLLSSGTVRKRSKVTEVAGDNIRLAMTALKILKLSFPNVENIQFKASSNIYISAIGIFCTARARLRFGAMALTCSKKPHVLPTVECVASMQTSLFQLRPFSAMFRLCVLPASCCFLAWLQPWRCSWLVRPKHRLTFNRLLCIISQKICLFMYWKDFLLYDCQSNVCILAWALQLDCYAVG